jgi:hypothetical protein
MSAYAVTIFFGAFLLFQMQPIVAKYILPWFGGSPGVWTACLLFFQLLLVGGYAYAHLTSRWLRPRTQASVHLVLLAAALALLPITPSDAWKPSGEENAALRILALLAASIGLPYFVLSSTGPLVQRWFSLANPGRSPYRLYALSNVGSLLALATFPFFFENHFTRKTQATIWGWGLGAFALCCAFCVTRLWKTRQWQEAESEESKATFENGGSTNDLVQRTTEKATRPTVLTYLLWLLLPACASVLLLATTNKLCQDVAVIPLLWILPLVLYLLSFAICFDSPRWYRRFPFGLALLGTLGWLCWALPKGPGYSLRVLLSGYSVCLFIGCMACHGELYRLRPGPHHLTSFYLMIAVGGALGGVLVAIVAPLIFNDFHELKLGFSLAGLLFLLILTRSDGPRLPYRHWLAPACFSLCLVIVLIVMWGRTEQFKGALVERARNFYGVLTVYEFMKDDPVAHHRTLVHGQTAHGLQFLNPASEGIPTLYYGAQSSGVGLAMQSLPERGWRVGLVGLGVGTLAAYCRTNDYLRGYELNPEVVRLATKYFTFAGHCLGKAECVIGDARLSLEKEPPQRFDLLALDAFNSDSIPVHLLTKEAFMIYDRHMNTNGIIAVHISNNYIDLEPVLVNLAHEMNLSFAVFDFHSSPDQFWIKPNVWVLLSRSREALDAPLLRRAARAPEPNCDRVRLWTDDFTSLYQVLF